MVRKRNLYSSAIRSRQMIREALIELMAEKHFYDISISEIMKRADLVRRTFYAHFKTKEDVLITYIDELISESIEEVMKGVQKCSGTLALIYFRLWYDHKEFVNLLKKNNQLPLLKAFEKYISHINKQFNAFSNMGFSKKAEKYASNFYAGAMWNVLDMWLEDGMEETPEELSDLFSELFLMGKQVEKNTCGSVR